MGAFKFKSAGLFLVIFLFLAQGTLGWIRFRYPFSRRVYLQQTSLERLQHCGEQPAEQCGVCGEGPGELKTTTIPVQNYLPLELTDNVLDVQVAFRADLLGHFEFRLCELGQDVVESARQCRDIPPLVQFVDRRSYSPSARQSSVTIPVAFPDRTACEKCVLQVKYTPGKDPDNLGNHAYYDCAPVTLATTSVNTVPSNNLHTGFPPDHATTMTRTETVKTSSMRGSSTNPRVASPDSRVASLVLLGRTGGQNVAQLVINEGSAGVGGGRLSTNVVAPQTSASASTVVSDNTAEGGFAESVVVRNNFSSRTTSTSAEVNQTMTDGPMNTATATNNNAASESIQTNEPSRRLAEEMSGVAFIGNTLSGGSRNTVVGNRDLTNSASRISVDDSRMADSSARRVSSDNTLTVGSAGTVSSVQSIDENTMSGGLFGAVRINADNSQDNSFNNIINDIGKTTTGESGRAFIRENSLSGTIAVNSFVRDSAGSESTISGSAFGTGVIGNIRTGLPGSTISRDNNIPIRTVTVSVDNRSVDSPSNNIVNDNTLVDSSGRGNGNTFVGESTVSSRAFGSGVIGNTLMGETGRTTIRNNNLSRGTLIVNTGSRSSDGSLNNIVSDNTLVSDAAVPNTFSSENTTSGGSFRTGVVGNTVTDKTGRTVIRNNNLSSKTITVNTNNRLADGSSGDTVRDSVIANTFSNENIMSGGLFGTGAVDNTMTRGSERPFIHDNNLSSRTITVNSGSRFVDGSTNNIVSEHTVVDNSFGAGGNSNVGESTIFRGTFESGAVDNSLTGEPGRTAIRDNNLSRGTIEVNTDMRFVDDSSNNIVSGNTLVSNPVIPNTFSSENTMSSGLFGTGVIADTKTGETERRVIVNNNLSSGTLTVNTGSRFVDDSSNNVVDKNTLADNSFRAGGNTIVRHSTVSSGTFGSGSVENSLTGEPGSTGIRGNSESSRTVVVNIDNRLVDGSSNNAVSDNSVVRHSAIPSTISSENTMPSGTGVMDNIVTDETGRIVIRGNISSGALTVNGENLLVDGSSNNFVDDNTLVRNSLSATGNTLVGDSRVASSGTFGAGVAGNPLTGAPGRAFIRDNNLLSAGTFGVNTNRRHVDDSSNNIVSGNTMDTSVSSRTLAVNIDNRLVDGSSNNADSGNSLIRSENTMPDGLSSTRVMDTTVTGETGRTIIRDNSLSSGTIAVNAPNRFVDGSSNNIVNDNTLVTNPLSAHGNAVVGESTVFGGTLGTGVIDNAMPGQTGRTIIAENTTASGFVRINSGNGVLDNSQRTTAGIFSTGSVQGNVGGNTFGNDFLNSDDSIRNTVGDVSITSFRPSSDDNALGTGTGSTNVIDNISGGTRGTSVNDLSVGTIRSKTGDSMIVRDSIGTNAIDNTFSGDFRNTVAGDLQTDTTRGNFDGTVIASESLISTTNDVASGDFTGTATGDLLTNSFDRNTIDNTVMTESVGTSTNSGFDNSIFPGDSRNMAGGDISSSMGRTVVDRTVSDRTVINGNQISMTNRRLSNSHNVESNPFHEILVGHVVAGEVMRGANAAKPGMSRMGVDTARGAGTLESPVPYASSGDTVVSTDIYKDNSTSGNMFENTGRSQGEFYTNDSSVPMERYSNATFDSWLSTDVNQSDSSGSYVDGTVQTENIMYENQVNTDMNFANRIADGRLTAGEIAVNNVGANNVNETYTGLNINYDWYSNNSTNSDNQVYFNDSTLLNETYSRNERMFDNTSYNEVHQANDATRDVNAVSRGMETRDWMYQNDFLSGVDPVTTTTVPSLSGDIFIQNDNRPIYETVAKESVQNTQNATNIDDVGKTMLRQEIVSVPNTITVFPLDIITPKFVTSAAKLKPGEVQGPATFPPVPSTAYNNILAETTTTSPNYFQSLTDFPTQTTGIPFPVREMATSTQRTLTARGRDAFSVDTTQNYDYIPLLNTENPFHYDRRTGAGTSRQDRINNQNGGQRIVAIELGPTIKDHTFTRNEVSSANNIHSGSSIVTNDRTYTDVNEASRSVSNQPSTDIKGVEISQYDQRGSVFSNSQGTIQNATAFAPDVPIDFYDVTTQTSDNVFGTLSTVAPDTYNIFSNKGSSVSRDITSIEYNNVNAVQGYPSNIRNELRAVATDTANNVIGDINNSRVDTHNIFYDRETTTEKYNDNFRAAVTELPATVKDSDSTSQPTRSVYDATNEMTMGTPEILYKTTTTEAPRIIYEPPSTAVPNQPSISTVRNNNVVTGSESLIELATIKPPVSKVDYTLVDSTSVNNVKKSTSTQTEDVHFMDLVNNVDNFGGVPINNGQVVEPGSFFILSKTASSQADNRISDGTSFDVTNSLSSGKSIGEQTRTGFVVYNYSDTASTGNSFGDSIIQVQRTSQGSSSENQAIADIVRNGDSSINRIKLNVESGSKAAVIDAEIAPNTMPPVEITKNVPEVPMVSRVGVTGTKSTDTVSRYDINKDNTADVPSRTTTLLENMKSTNNLGESRAPIATSTVWRGRGILGETSQNVHSLNKGSDGDMNDQITYHYFNLIKGNAPSLQTGPRIQYDQLSKTVDIQNTLYPTTSLKEQSNFQVENDMLLTNDSNKTTVESSNTNVSSSTLWDLNRRNKDSADSTKVNTMNYDVTPRGASLPGMQSTGTRLDRTDTTFIDQPAPDMMPPIAVSFAGDGTSAKSAQTITSTSGDINIRILQTLEELVTELRKQDPAASTKNFTDAWSTDGVSSIQYRLNTNTNIAGQDTGANTVRQNSNVNTITLATDAQGTLQFSPIVDTDMFYLTDSITNEIPPPIIPRDSIAGFNEIGTVKLGNLKGVRDERQWLSDTANQQISLGNNKETVNQNLKTSEASFQQPVISLPEQTGSMYQILMGTFANISATKRNELEEIIANNVNNRVLNTQEATSMDTINVAQQTLEPVTELPIPNEARLDAVRTQRVIHATEGQIQNPFAGTNIPLEHITNKLGNIIAMEPQYRASSSDAALDHASTVVEGNNRASNDRNPISIEGKYYIGEMRRNIHGQFEPVPVGADVLLQTNNVPQLPRRTETVMSKTVTTNNVDITDTKRPTVFANLPAGLTNENQGLDPGNQNFINQETLLNLIKRQQDTTSVRTEITERPERTATLSNALPQSPGSQSVVCNAGERFVCNAVGSYRNIPGMVWWCFSHCKNGVCPREKCDCSCNRKEGLLIKALQVPHTNNKSRVKKVINLTLNGSKESLVRVGEGFSGSESSEKILQPRMGEASLGASQRLNVDNTVVMEASRNVKTSDKTQLVCRGVNAFAGTAGMDTWCTTMCRRNVCPPEICAC